MTADLKQWTAKQLSKVIRDEKSIEILKNKDRHLNQFAIHKRTKRKLFDKISLNKAISGDSEYRPINAPSKQWKAIQSQILDYLTFANRSHRASTGFELGKNVTNTSTAHKGNKYFLLTDIEQCFNSLKIQRVEEIARKMLNLSKRDSRIFASLTTYKGETTQGLVTSPALVNLAMLSMDRRLSKLCRKYGITYTRYADDLTFSCPNPIPVEIRKKIFWIITKEGWKPSKKKTHYTKQRYINLNGILLDTETSRTFAKKAIRVKKRKYQRKIKSLQKKKQLTDAQKDEMNHLRNRALGCDAFETLVKRKTSNPLKTKRGLLVLRAVELTLNIWDLHGYPLNRDQDFLNLARRIKQVRWTRQAMQSNKKSWKLHCSVRPRLEKLIQMYYTS